MYRSREEYNEISRVVAEIYVDYGITSKDFPLDEKEICRKWELSSFLTVNMGVTKSSIY